MTRLNLVMPMAGRGSRFSAEGMPEPKPLIDLGGKPFFWWAVESVMRAAVVDQLAFVVLDEHEREYGISSRILDFYPGADIIRIPDVTSGSAETALFGLSAIEGEHPVAINDCDHAFLAGDLDKTLANLATRAAALMTFRASSPTFSYVALDSGGAVCGTVEKRAVSPFAIAGCYLFQSGTVYRQFYESYKASCPYTELFISGIYNEILRAGQTVDLHLLQEHFPFGTPEELRAVKDSMPIRLREWM